MQKVVIVGPFNAIMKAALEECLGSRYQIEYVTSRDGYSAAYDADYVILRTLNFDADDIGKMHDVKLIQRWGAGFDTVDIEAAGKKGIPVAVTAGINATPVAEMSLALALAVYRNIVPLTNGVMSGKWEREAYSNRSFCLNSKTVGVIGIGNIGKKVANLYKAFGSKVVYYDPFRLSMEQEKALGVEFRELNELLQISDIVTLHAPLLDSTRNIINAESLSLFKKGAVLINTARSELVDLKAVAEALSNGSLLGAGFDAIEESLASENPFKGMQNVVLTTHLGGNTADNVQYMAKRCAEQIDCIAGGGSLVAPHLVNGNFLVRK